MASMIRPRPAQSGDDPSTISRQRPSAGPLAECRPTAASGSNTAPGGHSQPGADGVTSIVASGRAVIPGECASSSSGAEATKGGSDGVTERQAHGSQPVGVRSGETPGSPVARPPASGEIPGSRRGAAQLASPQHEAKPAASLGIPARADPEGAEPAFQWRRPWTAPGSLERVPRNPPA